MKLRVLALSVFVSLIFSVSASASTLHLYATPVVNNGIYSAFDVEFVDDDGSGYLSIQGDTVTYFSGMSWLANPNTNTYFNYVAIRYAPQGPSVYSPYTDEPQGIFAADSGDTWQLCFAANCSSYTGHLANNWTYRLETVSNVPLPAALPLFGTGLGLMGLLGWRRKRKASAIAAA